MPVFNAWRGKRSVSHMVSYSLELDLDLQVALMWAKGTGRRSSGRAEHVLNY